MGIAKEAGKVLGAEAAHAAAEKGKEIWSSAQEKNVSVAEEAKHRLDETVQDVVQTGMETKDFLVRNRGVAIGVGVAVAAAVAGLIYYLLKQDDE